jgi:hypothetical protein
VKTLLLLGLAAAAAWAFREYRTWHLRWGASEEEQRRPAAGDGEGFHGGSSTRFLSRLRCRHDPTSLPGLAGILLMELGDFPMFRKLLLSLRQRAEARAASRKAGDADVVSG